MTLRLDSLTADVDSLPRLTLGLKKIPIWLAVTDAQSRNITLYPPNSNQEAGHTVHTPCIGLGGTELPGDTIFPDWPWGWTAGSCQPDVVL